MTQALCALPPHLESSIVDVELCTLNTQDFSLFVLSHTILQKCEDVS